MIRLNVFVRVSETNREKAIEAAKELTACSLKEEGCIAYDTFESSTRHDEKMKQELWQDWFIEHFPGGPTDPGYVLLKFESNHATYWIEGTFIHKKLD